MENGLSLVNEGAVVQVVLHSADGKNEVDDAMLHKLTQVVSEPPEGTVAIVLTGAGDNFCSGRAASPLPRPAQNEDLRAAVKSKGAAPILALYEAIRASSVPVACFVRGLASGLGCALVAACDHAVAEADSQFEATEIEKQFAPALLMSALFPSVHPKAIARLVLTAQSIDAQTALAAGLIGEIVEPGELDRARASFAAFMNSRAPHAVRGIKRFLHGAANRSSADRTEFAADVLADSVVERLKPAKPVTPSPGMRYLDRAGERIAYLDAGAGPAVVLLHSLGTSSALWDDILPALSARYRVIAIDARGHGHSTKHQACTGDDIAKDVIAVADAAEVDRFALLGISMGGQTAIRVAAEAGRRVTALVLSSAYADVSGPEAEQRLAVTGQTLKKLPMHVFAGMYVEHTLNRNTPYPGREKLAQQIAAVSPQHYLETLQIICRDDVTHLLHDIEAPTLVLNAQNDASVPQSVSAKLTEGIRGALERTLPDAAHLACIDAPEAYVETLLDFLDRHTNEDGAVWK
jgi:pimeloyl-ACP methyl ester carboxylesterase/enoyl-CoA hydratase/carnithine racemase